MSITACKISKYQLNNWSGRNKLPSIHVCFSWPHDALLALLNVMTFIAEYHHLFKWALPFKHSRISCKQFMCARDEDSGFDSIEGRHLGTNSKSLSITYFHISLANLNSELFSEKRMSSSCQSAEETLYFSRKGLPLNLRICKYPPVHPSFSSVPLCII